MSGQNRGGAWRPQARKSSSTAGILKAPHCQKSDIKVRYAKDSRFYKTDPVNYEKACIVVNKLNEK